MSIGIAQTQVSVKSGGSSGAGGNWLDVKSFGATGSASLLFGGSTIASATNTLNNSNAPWTAGDVGKVIMVAGAGVNGVDLWTTILAFTDASNIVLAANASTSLP